MADRATAQAHAASPSSRAARWMAWMQRRSTQGCDGLSAPRGLRRVGAQHRSPRDVLCVWSTTTSSSPFSTRQARFGLRLGLEVAACVHSIFKDFGLWVASKPEILSGLAGAERHRREIGPEYPSATPKRRNRAAATRPRVSSGAEKKRDLPGVGYSPDVLVFG